MGKFAGRLSSALRVLMLGLLVSGWPGAARAADPPTTLRIAVVAFYAGGQTQLTGVESVMDQQGWLRGELAKRGITLEWYPVSTTATGPLINEAFARHIIQFGAYSDLPSIILNSSGSSVRTEMVVPWAPNDAVLVVPKDSTAKSIEDLKGKRLAIHKGRPWELPLLRLLDSKGLSYADFQVYNINPEAGASAVAIGGVDALMTNTTGYALQEKGVARVIWTTKEAPLAWRSWGGLWVDRDFARQHADLTQLVVTAYVKASAWIADDANKDAFIKLGTRNGTSESVLRWTYDDPHLSWRDHWSPRFRPELYEHYRLDIAYARDKKIIRNDVSATDLLDPSFALVALKTLGLEAYWRP
jgi:sulfonate transport system substrate-binding protein